MVQKMNGRESVEYNIRRKRSWKQNWKKKVRRKAEGV